MAVNRDFSSAYGSQVLIEVEEGDAASADYAGAVSLAVVAVGQAVQAAVDELSNSGPNDCAVSFALKATASGALAIAAADSGVIQVRLAWTKSAPQGGLGGLLPEGTLPTAGP